MDDFTDQFDFTIDVFRHNNGKHHILLQEIPNICINVGNHRILHNKYPGHPVLYFYTTENHKVLQTRCIGTRYGQLRNEELWIPLYPRSEPYKKIRRAHCIQK